MAENVSPIRLHSLHLDLVFSYVDSVFVLEKFCRDFIIVFELSSKGNYNFQNLTEIIDRSCVAVVRTISRHFIVLP